MTKLERIAQDKARARRYTRNIVRAYRKASDRQRQAGAAWYPNESAATRTVGAGLTREQCAGIVAALSPGLKWTRNVWWARELALAWREGRAESLKIPTYCYGNVRKAIRILAGESPNEVLSGPKVTAFYRLLRDGGNSADVCVDGHAVLIAKGEDGTIRGEGSKAARVTEAQYKLVADCYRRAARTVGARPFEVQATTWLAKRAAGQEEVPF